MLGNLQIRKKTGYESIIKTVIFSCRKSERGRKIITKVLELLGSAIFRFVIIIAFEEGFPRGVKRNRVSLYSHPSSVPRKTWVCYKLPFAKLFPKNLQ